MTHDELKLFSHGELASLAQALNGLDTQQKLEKFKACFARISQSKHDKQTKQDMYAKLAVDLYPTKLHLTHLGLYQLIAQASLFPDIHKALDEYEVLYPLTLPNLNYLPTFVIASAVKDSLVLTTLFSFASLLSGIQQGVLERLNNQCDKVLMRIIDVYKHQYSSFAAGHAPLSRVYQEQLWRYKEKHAAHKKLTPNELYAIEELQLKDISYESYLTGFDRLQLIKSAVGSLLTTPLPAGVVNAGFEIGTRFLKGAVVFFSGVVFAITEVARPLNVLLTLAECVVSPFVAPVMMLAALLGYGAMQCGLFRCCKVDPDACDEGVANAPAPFSVLGGQSPASQQAPTPQGLAPSHHAGGWQPHNTVVNEITGAVVASPAP